MKSLLQSVVKTAIKTASRNWKPYSHLIMYGDSVGWSLDWDMRELAGISRKLGIKLARPHWKHAASPQSIFFASQFFLLENDWERLLPNRIGFSYFHGIPNSSDNEFDTIYDALKQHHEKLTRIQVSHTAMRDIVLTTGIDPSKVYLIPIGINLQFFSFRSIKMRRDARMKLNLPTSAFVIGSFQKDGMGWGDGMEPKLIKGPDVFVEVMKRLKREIPELVVLLSGPARGYVKQKLEEAEIPYRHVYLKSYPEIAGLYHALDLYVVSSRQEGGPKAILESMASGVPLVTTRVGQAMDLVKHGENAWMADVEDVDALAAHTLRVYRSSSDSLQPILTAGRKTAEANSYESQIPLWAEFMKGFVE